MNARTGRVRYYVHGDGSEAESGTFYCARCDMFTDAVHFTTCVCSGRSSDGALIVKGMAKLDGQTVPAISLLCADPEAAARAVVKHRRASLYRPDNAPSIWDRKRG